MTAPHIAPHDETSTILVEIEDDGGTEHAETVTLATPDEKGRHLIIGETGRAYGYVTVYGELFSLDAHMITTGHPDLMDALKLAVRADLRQRHNPTTVTEATADPELCVERSGRFRGYDGDVWLPMAPRKLLKTVALDHIAEFISERAAVTADADYGESDGYSVRVQARDNEGEYDITYAFTPAWRS